MLGLPGAIATMLVPPLLAAAALSTGLAGAGLVIFPRALVALRRWAEWNRRRAAGLLGVPVSSRYVSLSQGIRAQWRQVLDDPETRRDIGWVWRHIATGIPAGLAALACIGTAVFTVVAASLWWLFPADAPLRLLTAIPVTSWSWALALGGGQIVISGLVAFWAVPKLARFHARTCLAALEPSDADQLAERVGELSESRAGVLDAHGAELRRIERDLHDGTQARLVAIAMQLGMARETLPEGSEPLAELLRHAHEGAEEAMSELRDVIRTMYPPILADRGLAGALAALGARSGVPAEVDLGEVGRLPAAVEAAAYFIVAETLANAAKHSCATRVLVRLTRAGDSLLIEVTDDGIGGVAEARGTGVIGIRRRAAALDGTVLVTSPVGGPTSITVELPCGL
ncbi:sensor histidine kinase [Acrocarpospora macrocephala]|uniref:histidine kinase n=1 Tax=Acrocarpospora macrocephala TaxID=150177 RepID=A0A5M3XC06_9ACTN|nr:histidine kinase [Acrocarpospora macrocephala]